MLNKFIDEEGKIKVWPSKNKDKLEILEYLASKFDDNKEYSEKHVNDIIKKWHTFNDILLLRRSLIDYKLLLRTSDGRIYWKGYISEE